MSNCVREGTGLRSAVPGVHKLILHSASQSHPAVSRKQHKTPFAPGRRRAEPTPGPRGVPAVVPAYKQGRGCPSTPRQLSVRVPQGDPKCKFVFLFLQSQATG